MKLIEVFRNIFKSRIRAWFIKYIFYIYHSGTVFSRICNFGNLAFCESGILWTWHSVILAICEQVINIWLLNICHFAFLTISGQTILSVPASVKSIAYVSNAAKNSVRTVSCIFHIGCGTIFYFCLFRDIWVFMSVHWFY